VGEGGQEKHKSEDGLQELHGSPIMHCFQTLAR
jgi:hypothetical protein